MYIHGDKFKIYKNKKHCNDMWSLLIQLILAPVILFFGLGFLAAILNLIF